MSHKMQSPKHIRCIGIGSSGAVLLPPGEWFQVVHFSAGTIRYRYGNITSPALYPAVAGLSPVILHPGTEVFIEIIQADNTDAFIHVRGCVPDNPNAEGYNA